MNYKTVLDYWMIVSFFIFLVGTILLLGYMIGLVDILLFYGLYLFGIGFISSISCVLIANEKEWL